MHWTADLCLENVIEISDITWQGMIDINSRKLPTTLVHGKKVSRNKTLTKFHSRVGKLYVIIKLAQNFWSFESKPTLVKHIIYKHIIFYIF